MFLAHVRWFVNSNVDLGIASLYWYEIIFVIAGVGAFLGIVGLLSKAKPIVNILGKLQKSVKVLAHWTPTVVRITVGLLLLINSWNELFYAPNIDITSNYQEFISYLLGGIGVLLILGVLVRSAAVTLAVLYLFSFFGGEPLLILEHVEYLGLAGYLALAGGGHARVTIMDKFDINELRQFSHYAVTFIRVGAGLGLSVLALTEKLLNFSDAQQFLNEHNWNLLAPLGASDRMFIIIAGIVELGVGLSLIFNVGTKLTTLALLGLFVTTALLLGMDEVVGHMFAVGVVMAVWTNFPKEKPVKIFKEYKLFG